MHLSSSFFAYLYAFYVAGESSATFLSFLYIICVLFVMWIFAHAHEFPDLSIHWSEFLLCPAEKWPLYFINDAAQVFIPFIRFLLFSLVLSIFPHPTKIFPHHFLFFLLCWVTLKHSEVLIVVNAKTHLSGLSIPHLLLQVFLCAFLTSWIANSIPDVHAESFNFVGQCFEYVFSPSKIISRHPFNFLLEIPEKITRFFYLAVSKKKKSFSQSGFFFFVWHEGPSLSKNTNICVLCSVVNVKYFKKYLKANK